MEPEKPQPKRFHELYRKLGPQEKNIVLLNPMEWNIPNKLPVLSPSNRFEYPNSDFLTTPVPSPLMNSEEPVFLDNSQETSNPSDNWIEALERQYPILKTFLEEDVPIVQTFESHLQLPGHFTFSDPTYSYDIGPLFYEGEVRHNYQAEMPDSWEFGKLGGNEFAWNELASNETQNPGTSTDYKFTNVSTESYSFFDASQNMPLRNSLPASTLDPSEKTAENEFPWNEMSNIKSQNYGFATDHTPANVSQESYSFFDSAQSMSDAYSFDKTVLGTTFFEGDQLHEYQAKMRDNWKVGKPEENELAWNEMAQNESQNQSTKIQMPDMWEFGKLEEKEFALNRMINSDIQNHDLATDHQQANISSESLSFFDNAQNMTDCDPAYCFDKTVLGTTFFERNKLHEYQAKMRDNWKVGKQEENEFAWNEITDSETHNHGLATNQEPVNVSPEPFPLFNVPQKSASTPNPSEMTVKTTLKLKLKRARKGTPKSPADPSDETALKLKLKKARKGTPKTPAQLKILNKHFSMNPYPTKLAKETISKETGLSKTVIGVWFSNTRKFGRKNEGETSNTNNQ